MKRFKIFLLNGFILTATSFFMRMVAFSFNVYISKRVGAEALGVFQLIVSVYLFMITIATSGISLATTRIIVEETSCCTNRSTKQAMASCLFYSIVFGLFACGLLVIFAPFVTKFVLHERVSSVLLYIVAISLPFIAVSSCLNGFFTALRKNGKNAICRIFEQLVKIVSTGLLLSVFLPTGLEYACLSLVLGETISEICSCLFTYFLYQIELRKHMVICPSSCHYLQKILHISLPVAITSYIRSGLSSLKQALIPSCLEKSGLSCNKAISFYGIISSMVMPVLLFPEVLINSFSSLVVPEFAYYDTKKDNRKITYVTGRIFRITFLFSIGILGVFLFYSNEVSYLFYQNFDIGFYIKVLSPLILFMYLDSIIDNILKGLNEQFGVMKCNILDLFSSIFFIYFFLPFWGFNGYIVVIYISELLNFGISFYQLYKKTHFSIDVTNWLIKPFFRNRFFVFNCSITCCFPFFKSNIHSFENRDFSFAVILLFFLVAMLLKHRWILKKKVPISLLDSFFFMFNLLF